jgi:hypothetical protein
MISFIVVALIGIVIIAAVNRIHIAWWWRAMSALVLTAALVLPTYFLFETPSLGEQPSWAAKLRTTPFREFILFALLLTGMIARVLSVAIERRGQVEMGKGLDIDRWQFVYPMLFAIPTFAGLLNQLQTSELALTDIVLAFQTGFFWQTILKRAEPKG